MPAQVKPAVTVGGTFLIGEFGSPRIESIGAGTITRMVYAFRPTKDELSFWPAVMVTIESEELANPHTEYYNYGFVSNKDRNHINFAPTEDGSTIAGPEGLDYDMLLELYNGAKTGTKFAKIPDPNDPSKTINEIDLCQGHRLLQFCDENGRPFLRKLPPSNFTQLIFKMIGDPSRMGKEDFQALITDGLALESDDLSIFEGYCFDWGREEQDYKARDKDGKETEGYDVLVPMAFVSGPDKKADNKSKTTTVKSAAKPNTTTSTSSTESAVSTSSESDSESPYSEDVTQHILKTLMEMKGEQKREKWGSKAVKSAPPELKAMIIDAQNDETYLFNDDRPWNFDKDRKVLWA